MKKSDSDQRPGEARSTTGRTFVSAVSVITLIAWASKVINLTIVGYTGGPELTGEWRPFFSMWQIASGPGNTLYQLGGNIALFIPLGLLLPLAMKSLFNRLGRTLLAGFTLSAGIELAQMTLVKGRVATTDDVLLNVSGVFVGWLLWRVLVRAFGAPTARPPADVSKTSKTRAVAT